MIVSCKHLSTPRHYFWSRPGYERFTIAGIYGIHACEKSMVTWLQYARHSEPTGICDIYGPTGGFAQPRSG
jgi:hypothetical protein